MLPREATPTFLGSPGPPRTPEAPQHPPARECLAGAGAGSLQRHGHKVNGCESHLSGGSINSTRGHFKLWSLHLTAGAISVPARGRLDREGRPQPREAGTHTGSSPPRSEIMVQCLEGAEGGRVLAAPSDAETSERRERARRGAGDPLGPLPPSQAAPEALLHGSASKPVPAGAGGKLLGPGFKSHLLFCQP